MFQLPGGRIFPPGHDHRLDGLSPERIRYADHAALSHGGMLQQHVFHLIGTHAVPAGLDDVVKASLKPVAAVFIPAGRVARMIHSAAPYMVVLLLIVQVSGEYAGLLSRFLRYNHDLSRLIHPRGLSLLVAEFNMVEGRRHPHGAFHCFASFEISEQEGRFRLAIAFAEGKPRALCKPTEHLRCQHFPGCGGVLQRRHFRNSFPYQVAIHSRRRAEGGHTVFIDDMSQLFRLKIVKVIDHHSAAHQPLAVKLSPGSLRPACFRHGKVEAIILRLLPVFRCHNMGQRITVTVDHAFRISRCT